MTVEKSDTKMSNGGDKKIKLEMKMEPRNTINCLGIRHLQIACMCFVVVCLYIARSCMGVAVLAMSDETKRNDTTIIVYDWNENTQGVILSSFFWGYVMMQIPAGLLSKKFGGKPILTFALIINGLLSCLLPTMAAVGGWMFVCFARVMMGLSQACLFPATQTLLGQWLPVNERTSYSGFVFGGVQLGTIIAMPVSGLLAETALGWELIFYAMSVLLVFATGVWHWCGSSSPAEHRWIGKEERQFIENSLHSTSASKTMRTPWRQILTSVPLYAILSSHSGLATGFALFFTDMPTYIEKGLQMSLKDSAALSALPYIGMWIGNTGSAMIAAKLLNKNVMSVGTSRKIFNSLGLFGTAAGMIVLAFTGPESKQTAICALVGALTMSGFCIAGSTVNTLDLSPNFAGVLFSFTNCIANCSSILMPIITSFILDNDPSDISRWRIVFLTTAGISIVANIIYVAFSSSEMQAWNDPDFMDKRKSDPEEMRHLAENKDNQHQ